ncbi:alpha/beta fold hydrolase [Herbiconiux sp. A18JL235]|uniref:Alpha/beta fold hydrolase n=1 Tax=Herbiconiux sp. A18JL235 TaxID=3152363 RepID=A0AB39BGA3_9MICO
MPQVESGGVAIDYEVLGDRSRPAVLLVHGFSSGRDANWLRPRWGKALDETGFSVVALDLRGHGRSGRPHSLAAYALPRFRADLVAVLDAAGVPSVHVLGYSLGARLAWDLALAHPDRVRSLALGGPPATGSFAGFDLDAAKGVAEASPGSPTARYLGMIDAVPGNDRAALIRVAEAGRRSGWSPLSAMPAHPLLFVAGGDDPVAGPTRELAGRIPHAAFVGVPGRDHITTITSRIFRDAVVDFFAAATPAGRPDRG